MGVLRTGLIRRLGGFTLAAAAMIATTVGAATPAAAAQGNILGLGTANVVKDSYLVVLKESGTIQQNRAVSVGATVNSLVSRYGGNVTFTYHAALTGFSATMSEQQARRLAADPNVAYVEADKLVHITDTQTNPPSWGLDRIDQRNLPLDSTYTYPNTASNVNAYIIDTGIRTTHRLRWPGARPASTPIDGGTATTATGTARTWPAPSAAPTYGVAKGVRLVARARAELRRLRHLCAGHRRHRLGHQRTRSNRPSPT